MRRTWVQAGILLRMSLVHPAEESTPAIDWVSFIRALQRESRAEYSDSLKITAGWRPPAGAVSVMAVDGGEIVP